MDFWDRSRTAAVEARRQGASEIDHRLLRGTQLHKFRTGQISRAEVCDASPELFRVAESFGDAQQRPCPICGESSLVNVTFAFGKGLPKMGRAVGSNGELDQIRQARESVDFYVVEVCRDCGWNFLLRKIEERNPSAAEG